MRRIKVFEIEFEDYSNVDNKELLISAMVAKNLKLKELGDKMNKDFKFNDENNVEFIKDIMRENIELFYLLEKMSKLEK